MMVTEKTQKMLLVNDLYNVSHRTVIPPLYFDRKNVIPLIKNDNITIDEHFNEIRNQSKCLSDLTINYFLYCIKRTKQFIDSNLYELILDLRVEGMLTGQGTPMGKAVALAYMNSVITGHILTQRDIAESMHFTESALRRNLKNIKNDMMKLTKSGEVDN